MSTTNQKEPVAAEAIAVRDPATGETVEELRVDDREAVKAAAEELRAAQPSWEALGPKGRAAALRRLRDWLLDNEDRLADLYQRETSKPRQDALLEILVAVDVLNYYADNAADFLQTRKPRPHSLPGKAKQLRLDARPYPLVGIITPWNFPIALVALDAIPALAAGCAVLLKPSEVNPLAIREMVRAWREDLGLPPVLDTVVGAAETGEAVVDASDYVQFTGSTGTGKLIAKRAAETLKPVGLELGGKDAMIVLADADLERAANAAAWGAMFNSGQTCISVERIYAEAPVYDEFLQHLTRAVAELRQGRDEDRFEFDLGAMMTGAQLETVEEHVDEAVAAGARTLTGGHRVEGPGGFFEPTVLVDVDHSMACMREETFGPTAPLMKVRDADEAVRLANDSPYGLSASVWTRDKDKALEVAGQLEVGAVNVNDVYSNLFMFALPHGGWKGSGLGARNGGADGLLKYCRRQAVTVGRMAPKRELLWFPYTERRAGMFRKISHLLGAGDIRRRLGRQAGD